MRATARRILAIAAVSSAVVPISLLVAPDETVTIRAIGVVGAILAAGMAALWARRWPTQRLSRVAMVSGAALAGAWSLAQSNAGVAATAATILAITGGYMAVFHNAKLVLLNFMVAVCVGGVAVARIASAVDGSAAIAVFWVIAFLNLVVPVAVRAIAQAMGTFATQSGEDSLTGLLNRRAFLDAVRAQIALRPTDHTHLHVLMVDLDNFKIVNDTRGHAAGDDALVAVARLLVAHTPSTAAIGRAGGEEFLIAHTSSETHTGGLADKLCALIAGLHHQITASIGASATPLYERDTSDSADLIGCAIAAADAAMYEAKRGGGDRSHQV